MSETLPNFLIVGAMRSGTTSLARYLGAHPDVFVAPEKEVHFFDRNFERGLDWYRQRFAGADQVPAVGEATQTYMYEEQAVSRLRSTLPRARLIAILRDPVDRAYSHYWLNRTLGSEALSFEDALEREPERLASGDVASSRTFSYLDRGRYLPQLERICALYSRSSVHVLLFDDVRDRPADAYADACSFLGVDSTFRPPNLGRPINRHVTFRSRPLRGLATGMPRPLRRGLERLNVRTDAYPPMDAALRQRLIEHFRAENQALAAWLDRDLSSWGA